MFAVRTVAMSLVRISGLRFVLWLITKFRRKLLRLASCLCLLVYWVLDDFFIHVSEIKAHARKDSYE